jgi:hypothetical protein
VSSNVTLAVVPMLPAARNYLPSAHGWPGRRQPACPATDWRNERIETPDAQLGEFGTVRGERHRLRPEIEAIDRVDDRRGRVVPVVLGDARDREVDQVQRLRRHAVDAFIGVGDPAHERLGRIVQGRGIGETAPRRCARPRDLLERRPPGRDLRSGSRRDQDQEHARSTRWVELDGEQARRRQRRRSPGDPTIDHLGGWLE